MIAQERVAQLDAASLELDAKRRAYYQRKNKHIKENIMQSDMGHTPVPQEDEDPELISARHMTWILDQSHPPAAAAAASSSNTAHCMTVILTPPQMAAPCLCSVVEHCTPVVLCLESSARSLCTSEPMKACLVTRDNFCAQTRGCGTRVLRWRCITSW